MLSAGIHSAHEGYLASVYQIPLFAYRAVLLPSCPPASFVAHPATEWPGAATTLHPGAPTAR